MFTVQDKWRMIQFLDREARITASIKGLGEAPRWRVDSDLEQKRDTEMIGSVLSSSAKTPEKAVEAFWKDLTAPKTVVVVCDPISQERTHVVFEADYEHWLPVDPKNKDLYDDSNTKPFTKPF